MTASIEENDRLLRDLQIGMQRIREEVESINERQRHLLESLRQMRTGKGVLRRSISAAWNSIVRRNSVSNSEVAS